MRQTCWLVLVLIGCLLDLVCIQFDSVYLTTIIILSSKTPINHIDFDKILRCHMHKSSQVIFHMEVSHSVKTEYTGLINVLIVCYNAGQEQMQHNNWNIQEVMGTHKVTKYTQETCMLCICIYNIYIYILKKYIILLKLLGLYVINQLTSNKTIFILQFNKLCSSPPTLSRPQKTTWCNLWYISQPEEGALLNAYMLSVGGGEGHLLCD